MDQTSLVLSGGFEPISFPLFHGVWYGFSGFFDGSLCMLVSSVCRGHQHASYSARGHWRSAFGAFRPSLPALSTAGSRNRTRTGQRGGSKCAASTATRSLHFVQPSSRLTALLAHSVRFEPSSISLPNIVFLRRGRRATVSIERGPKQFVSMAHGGRTAQFDLAQSKCERHSGKRDQHQNPEDVHVG